MHSLIGCLVISGALVEVLTDQGMEFEGEFQVLCDKALIDH
jgi:hypothetical protein